jgi:hypothetical protein
LSAGSLRGLFQTPSAPSALPEKPSHFEPNQLLILIKTRVSGKWRRTTPFTTCSTCPMKSGASSNSGVIFICIGHMHRRCCNESRRIKKSGASGEIRTLKHLFLRQAAIPVRACLHLVHRGGFEPPRPTWGDRVTAGPFRPGSRTCANLAEGRRIERPSLITMPRFSGPVAGHSSVPSAWRRVRELNPLASCENPCLADKCLTVRPTLR